MTVFGEYRWVDAKYPTSEKIATQIIKQKADYVLSLKGNQGDLHDDFSTFFNSHLAPKKEAINIDGDHGRIETRSVRMTSDIGWLRERHPKWVGLKSIIAVTAKRELRDKTEKETRYFISSLDDSNPERLREVVRAHWAMENNLHWVLDTAFDEDSNRTQKGYIASNLAVIRHITLNLIKNEVTSKVGIKTKRAKAGWDNQYLLKVLGIILSSINLVTRTPVNHKYLIS